MAPKLAMDTDIVNINQETFFSKLGFPYVIPMWDLKYKNSSIKSLISTRKIRNVKLAVRLEIFIQNCKTVINDREIRSGRL